MIRISTLLAPPLLAVSLLSVSSLASAQATTDAEAYAPGRPIHAELTLMERSREGGRHTPIFDHYRPTIAFDGAEPVVCEFFTDISGGHKPGTTGPVRLVCPVEASVGQNFTAHELGRKVGSGVVLARPEP